MNMNESGSRQAKRGSVVLTLAIVAVVGSLVAAAFALASNDGSRPSLSANTATTSPSTASTSAPATTGSATSASDAKPAVCADVKGATVMDDDMVMAPVPNRRPTATDEAAASKLIASVDTGIAKYSKLSAAVAAGYVPATNPAGRVVHYAKWSTVLAGDVLDANQPSSLVYANTVSGPVLLGAAPCRPGPDVAGPLTQWHAHADLCLAATHQVVGKSTASGQCAVGNHNTNTFFMTHVWTAPSLAQQYQFAAEVPRTAYAAIIRSGKA